MASGNMFASPPRNRGAKGSMSPFTQSRVKGLPPNYYMPPEWYEGSQLPPRPQVRSPFSEPSQSQGSMPSRGWYMNQPGIVAAIDDRTPSSSPKIPNSPLRRSPAPPMSGYFDRAVPKGVFPQQAPYNPTPRAFPGENAREEGDRLRMIQETPPITSSSQAGIVAGSNPMSSANAAITNGYDGRYSQPDLSGFQPGRSVQSPQDPTNLGGRFGTGGALNPMGEYSQSGQSWYDRLSTQEKYGYGPTTPGVDGRISSDRRYATGMLPKDPNRPQRGTPEDAAYRAEKYAQQEQRQQQYRDENDGMSSRQVRRAEQKQRTKDFQFGRAIQNGLNPMSPQAKFLFPDQVAELTKPSGPVSNPMSAAPDRTAAGQMAAAESMAKLAETAPVFKIMGVQPGAKVSDIHRGLTARMDEDPNVQFSDADIRALQEYARNADSISTEENDQFAIDSGVVGNVQDQVDSDLWRELAKLPDNERARADWFGKFKNRRPTGFNERAQQNNDSARDSGGNMFDVPYGM